MRIFLLSLLLCAHCANCYPVKEKGLRNWFKSGKDKTIEESSSHHHHNTAKQSNLKIQAEEKIRAKETSPSPSRHSHQRGDSSSASEFEDHYHDFAEASSEELPSHQTPSIGNAWTQEAPSIVHASQAQIAEAMRQANEVRNERQQQYDLSEADVNRINALYNHIPPRQGHRNRQRSNLPPPQMRGRWR